VTASAAGLRAMDMGDLLDRAVDHYRRNFITLFGVYAIGYAPFWLLVGISAHLFSGAFLRLLALGTPAAIERAGVDPALLGVAGFVVVLVAGIFFVEPIVTGATARAVSDQILGRPASIRGAYSAVRPRTAALLLSSFLRLVAVYGAHSIASFIAFIPVIVVPEVASDVVAGIAVALLQLGALLAASIIFIYLLFIGHVVAIENRGTAEALTRSWRLVSGRLWRTSGIASILFWLVAALTSAFQLPLLTAVLVWWPWDTAPENLATMGIVVTAALAATSLLASPILSIGTTFIYYDLRVRREGLDVEIMAASIGAGDVST